MFACATHPCSGVNVDIKIYKTLRNKKIGKATRFAIYIRDGFKCFYCGSKKELTLDHVIPVAAGGNSSHRNLITACEKCNREKANTHVEHYNTREVLEIRLNSPIDLDLGRAVYTGAIVLDEEYTLRRNG